MKKEFCIMPENPHYATERFDGAHRHEVFYGSYRQTSIKYGLVVFLTPEMHDMSNKGVHFNTEFNLYLRRIGQKAAMKHYGWTKEQFIKIFGKNYL